MKDPYKELDKGLFLTLLVLEDGELGGKGGEDGSILPNETNLEHHRPGGLLQLLDAAGGGRVF